MMLLLLRSIRSVILKGCTLSCTTKFPKVSFVLATDVMGRSRSAICAETSLTVHDKDGKLPVRMEVLHKKLKSALQQATKATGGVEI